MQTPTLHQHCAVQTGVTNLAKSISDLVRLRLDPVTAPLIANEEGNLLSCLASLQFLCSDLREERRSLNDNRTESDLDGEIAVVCGQLNSIETVGI
jgi:hypothetical protein